MTGRRATRPLTFLLGKPPRPGSLMWRVLAMLDGAAGPVEAFLPHESDGFGVGSLPPRGLIVQRGLRPAVLAVLAPMERAGRRFCNPISATRLVADRHRVSQRLAAAGLPIPTTHLAGDWQAAQALAGGRDVVVKAVDGTRGRGSGVALLTARTWPGAPPFDGPLLVQEHIANDGRDRKLYVAGATCFGLVKPRDAGSASRPFAPGRTLRHLARSAGAALGLDVFGVDIVLGPDGPVIVDVNPFPGFRGIEGAAGAVADHLLGLALYR